MFGKPNSKMGTAQFIGRVGKSLHLKKNVEILHPPKSSKVVQLKFPIARKHSSYECLRNKKLNHSAFCSGGFEAALSSSPRGGCVRFPGRNRKIREQKQTP
jgi:hypothetical protein